MREPLRQVHITSIIIPPKASGTQPPSAILSEFAPRKIQSTASSGSMTKRAAQSGQRQYRQMTGIAMVDVTTMVPVTAMP